jgi:transcription antitermination factor NusG
MNWFAVQVRSRSEFAIAQVLHNKGIEEFVPRYKTKSQWSDRTIAVELPLFPGYIFCRFDPAARLPILITEGVIRIVGIGKAPSPITDSEIEAVHRAVSSGFPVQPHSYLAIGSRILIKEGPLAGLEGILTGQKNRCFVVSIELIHCSISVDVQADALKTIRPVQPMQMLRSA